MKRDVKNIFTLKSTKKYSKVLKSTKKFSNEKGCKKIFYTKKY